jgi:rhodanese-related sulfurtransferase
MKITSRTIALSILGLTAGFGALTSTALFYPPFLRPLIALGLPTHKLNTVPLLGNAILAAQAPQINAKDLQDLKQREEILLIDVRTSAEFDRSHIPGAIHIPLRDIEDGSGIKTIQNLQQQQSKKIVTYCHSGARSHRAIDRLSQAGISATNLTGGIVQWRTLIDPNLKLPNS